MHRFIEISSYNIKFIIDQNRLIFQQVNTCIFEKMFHSVIQQVFFSALKSKSGKDWLI